MHLFPHIDHKMRCHTVLHSLFLQPAHVGLKICLLLNVLTTFGWRDCVPQE
jgi:hypothetical protein